MWLNQYTEAKCDLGSCPARTAYLLSELIGHLSYVNILLFKEVYLWGSRGRARVQVSTPMSQITYLFRTIEYQGRWQTSLTHPIHYCRGQKDILHILVEPKEKKKKSCLTHRVTY